MRRQEEILATSNIYQCPYRKLHLIVLLATDLLTAKLPFTLLAPNDGLRAIYESKRHILII